MRAVLIATLPTLPTRRPARPSWRARVDARLRAGRWDRALDAGAPVCPGTAPAVHAARLVSPVQRRRLAAGLQSALDRSYGLTAPVPLQCGRIRANGALIADVVARLTGSGPVRARGVARLRMLLTDGRGPLYATGGGSLAAQLRGVLAAL